MTPRGAPWSRRLLAGAVDLYHFFYVALLPMLIMGAVVFVREERMISREITRARAMPKGHWTDDPARAQALSAKRSAFLKSLSDDLWTQINGFLNSLAERLQQEEKFKGSLDLLIADRYTKLASDTVERGIDALRRHVRTPEGSASLAKLTGFLRGDLVKRLTVQIQAELDYRISQVADYLGFQGIGRRVRALISGEPGGAGGSAEVPEALEWTNLLDKVLGEKVDILPETRTNLAILRYSALGSLLIGLLFLALRDWAGRGGSAGKRRAGLHIVDRRTGKPASSQQLLLRGVVFVALLPLEILLAAMDLRVGDRLAGTRLVAE
jgi:hypothetical protein